MGCTCTWTAVPRPSIEASSLVLTVQTVSDPADATEALKLSDPPLHSTLTIPENQKKKKTHLTESTLGDSRSIVNSGDEVVLEEALMKYWPGYSRDYVERWCRLTPTALVYFVSHYKAALTADSPLDCIPLADIKFVAKVSLPSTRTFPNSLFAFELFLYNERAGTDFKHLTLRDPHRQLTTPMRGQRLVFCTHSKSSRNAWVKAFADLLDTI